jgi:hypothetical protein
VQMRRYATAPRIRQPQAATTSFTQCSRNIQEGRSEQLPYTFPPLLSALHLQLVLVPHFMGGTKRERLHHHWWIHTISNRRHRCTQLAHSKMWHARGGRRVSTSVILYGDALPRLLQQIWNLPLLLQPIWNLRIEYPKEDILMHSDDINAAFRRGT